MGLKRPILSLALVAGLTLAVPAAGTAMAQAAEPVAHAAGGDAPPLNPSIVEQPITHTANALDAASMAIDAGNGATAAGPLQASRRYLNRSYAGAKVLISTAAAAPVQEASANPATFRKAARRYIRASRSSARRRNQWIRAQGSQFAPPVFADAPTAVFNVLLSQYDASTTSIGMLPDVKGNLLTAVKTTANSAVILRNRVVKLVAAAAPPAAEAKAGQDVQAKAAQDDVTTFDVVMPGLAVLLADEIQQIQTMQADSTVPAASSAVLGAMLAADTQILNQVNTLWPPVTEG